MCTGHDVNIAVECKELTKIYRVSQFGRSKGITALRDISLSVFPATITGLVGPNGMALGLESFGFSAPAHVLDEKFGYTGKQVASQALKFLKGK